MKRLLSVCLSLCVMMSVFVSFDITASAKTTMKNPTVTVSNSAKSIDVKWKKVSGAKSYKVYRKVAGAKKYSVVKSTNNKTVKYADKKVSAGKTYYYQVVAVNGKDKATSATKSIVRLLAPKNVKVENYVSITDYSVNDDVFNFDGDMTFGDEEIHYTSGVKVSWTKSKGANKYEIYKKIGNGKYKKIKTTGNVSSYIDIYTSDKACYYKVVAKKNNSTSVPSAVKKNIYVEAPFLSATNIASGVKLVWDSDYCDGYKLYRSPNGKNGTYSLLAKVDKNTKSYVDKKASLNQTYHYKLVAYKGNANSCAVTLKIKYKANLTINIGVGKTDYTIKNAIEELLKVFNFITFEDIMKSIKITSLNPNVATVSDDYVITGVSKGTTMAKAINVLPTGEKKEAGFIIINVK